MIYMGLCRMRSQLVGRRFGGRVAVLRDSGKRQHRHVLWECACECGRTFLATGCNLRSGNTSSCGCHHAAMVAESNRWRSKVRRAARPTTALPGTAAKVEVMERRASLGLPVFREGDAPLPRGRPTEAQRAAAALLAGLVCPFNEHSRWFIYQAYLDLVQGEPVRHPLWKITLPTGKVVKVCGTLETVERYIQLTAELKRHADLLVIEPWHPPCPQRRSRTPSSSRPPGELQRPLDGPRQSIALPNDPLPKGWYISRLCGL